MNLAILQWNQIKEPMALWAWRLACKKMHAFRPDPSRHPMAVLNEVRDLTANLVSTLENARDIIKQGVRNYSHLSVEAAYQHRLRRTKRILCVVSGRAKAEVARDK